MQAVFPECRCCGSPIFVDMEHMELYIYDVEFTDQQEIASGICGMCHNRGGLCLHNIFSRTEEAGGPIGFHYSIPHEDDTGAHNPDTCQWCLSRLLDKI